MLYDQTTISEENVILPQRIPGRKVEHKCPNTLEILKYVLLSVKVTSLLNASFAQYH